MFSSKKGCTFEAQERFDPAPEEAAGAELCELPLHRVCNEVGANDPVAFAIGTPRPWQVLSLETGVLQHGWSLGSTDPPSLTLGIFTTALKL